MSAMDVLPLIKAPAGWPTLLSASVAMTGLAVLDLAGAMAAKEWATTKNVIPLVVGVLCFLMLFWLYASALQYAELAIVTLGWIVLLQVGLLVVDAWRYGVRHGHGTWVAIVIVLLGQAYLVLVPATTTS